MIEFLNLSLESIILQVSRNIYFAEPKKKSFVKIVYGFKPFAFLTKYSIAAVIGFLIPMLEIVKIFEKSIFKIYALVITLFRVLYEQEFMSFSYFANLFREP